MLTWTLARVVVVVGVGSLLLGVERTLGLSMLEGGKVRRGRKTTEVVRAMIWYSWHGFEIWTGHKHEGHREELAVVALSREKFLVLRNRLNRTTGSERGNWVYVWMYDTRM